MAYSIRGLFGVSALVAVFMAAVFSRSDAAILITTLVLVLVILFGTALAFTATTTKNFWRAFAVVAIGTVFMSPQVDLFEQLSYVINAKVRPAQPFAGSYSFSLPPSLPPASYAPITVTRPASAPAPRILPVMPAPTATFVSATNYSWGMGINQQLQKLLVVGSAILFGLVAGVLMDLLMLRSAKEA